VRGPTFVPGVFEFCRELGYNLITMPELRRDGFDVVAERVRKTLGDRPVYLCFDMDFFDPSVRARRLHADLGRLHVRRGLTMVERLSALNVVMLDVNTVSPPHDSAGMSAFLARHGDVELSRRAGRERRSFSGQVGEQKKLPGGAPP